MKIILAVFTLCSTPVFALTSTEREVVVEMRDTITLLRSSLDSARRANERSLAALTAASAQATDLTARLKVAADETAQLVAERDHLTSEISAARVNYAKLNARYQTAQLIIALSVAFAVGMLAMQFTHTLTPPYGIIVPIAAGAAAFFGIYIIL
jgi:hypothetical protein